MQQGQHTPLLLPWLLPLPPLHTHGSGIGNMLILLFSSFLVLVYLFSASSSPIILNVPCDSLVSISRLWISMSLFLTWYSSSNFSPKVTQDLSYSCLQRAARSSLLMAETSGMDPTFSRTASGTPILESTGELRL